ncbi:hypothetical protein CGRA01v4_08858 [Colletotrichum graminicola]|nr:hypothetical protein CGRA01v4_08858 [Colletotrichum graminicola]
MPVQLPSPHLFHFFLSSTAWALGATSLSTTPPCFSSGWWPQLATRSQRRSKLRLTLSTCRQATGVFDAPWGGQWSTHWSIAHRFPVTSHASTCVIPLPIALPRFPQRLASRNSVWAESKDFTQGQGPASPPYGPRSLARCHPLRLPTLLELNLPTALLCSPAAASHIDRNWPRQRYASPDCVG